MPSQPSPQPRRPALPALLIALLAIPWATLSGQVVEEKIIEGLDYARIQKDGVVVHVLKLSLKRKDLFVRSLKARGKETLRTMVDRLNKEGERVLGAINGDFFLRSSKAGVPHGVQVSDGQLIFAPRKRSMICFGPKNTPYIAVVQFQGELRLGKSRPLVMKIDAVNAFPKEYAGQSGVILYTPAFQELDAASYRGRVAAIEKITPALRVGERSKGRVARVEPGGTEIAVPDDGCLIYFLGEYADKLDRHLEEGTEIQLKLALPPIKGGVPQAIGGGPRLLRRGKVDVEFRKEDFDSLHMSHLNRSRHPRSAVGYDRKKRNLFLVMVEGRHEDSRGMTLGELGKYMKGLGCSDAMGFDGGGSAAMYVLGNGIASRSENEREIANSLVITTSRPELLLNPDDKSSE